MGNNKVRNNKRRPQPKVKIFNKKKEITPLTKIIEDLQARYETIEEDNIKTFDDLPLSSHTLKALKEHGFIEPTDIQKQSIPLALKGNDILGAAKTGSGKTLAFLIPVIEQLYCQQWIREHGLAVVIITPTRELAHQIFETVKKVAKYHRFTAGLIIGGKNLNHEKKLMDQYNIMVCTPGRLLHHMDHNRLMRPETIQIVVLDEADRCLDMGFEHTMNAIIENLPPERQTLMFSATQTKSVKDLARLSLTDPMYVSVHERAKHPTPEGLQQSYVTVELEDKMAMLWSFIKHHLKQKTIVFFSTCKQVKYTFEAFCRMRPGVSLMALYGTLHQLKRTSIYEDFCKKQHAVLFATDIAARGLDFPGINWVVQLDCPEDINSYIHRAGRTARYQTGGESLLVVLPSELGIVEQLIHRSIPINKIEINTNKLHSPHRRLEAQLVRDVALKESAQRAFVSYVKSVFLMKDKSIFDVGALNTDAYAKSLGLAIPPRIRCLERHEKKKKKQNQPTNREAEAEVDSDDEGLEDKLRANRKSSDDNSENDSEEETNEEEQEEEEKQDKIISKGTVVFGGIDSDDDEDVLTIKRKNIDIEGDISEEDMLDEQMETGEPSKKNKKALTKAAVAKKLMKKKILPNKKITFDEEGEEKIDATRSKISELAREYEKEEASGIDIELAKKILEEEDKFDKQRFREKIKEKHKEAKRKLKEKKKNEEEEDDSENEEQGSEESDGEGPDLSWLPDPDKIYGPKTSSNDEESDEEQEEDEEEESEDVEESEEEIEQIHKPRKRKLASHNDHKQKRPRIKITEKSDLQATEELALQLLRT